MRFLSLVLTALILALVGCHSVNEVPTNVRERFTGPAYRIRVFPSEQKKVYAAARTALDKMHYKFLRGGAAQGKIEALSVISGDPLKGARQTSLDIKMSPDVEGGTEVSLLFSEITEDDFNKRSSLGTSTPLHDTPLYEIFFGYLQEALGGQK